MINHCSLFGHRMRTVDSGKECSQCGFVVFRIRRLVVVDERRAPAWMWVLLFSLFAIGLGAAALGLTA